LRSQITVTSGGIVMTTGVTLETNRKSAATARSCYEPAIC
jgi:hypothetical protein